MIYLDFKTAKCKDCYKCLRDCPVKAIKIENHQAKIIDSRCILCGICTKVCPQNAKKVHSEIEAVKKLISKGNVIASVAPSFISSFDVIDFAPMKKALISLGFADAEETAVGAKAVTEEYRSMLKSGGYKNLISSACPAVDKLIEEYYPEAIKYLAPCDTPMIAHTKMLKKRYPGYKVVFVGPCIAKKREAVESNLVEGVLTFEDLNAMLNEKGIVFDNSESASQGESGYDMNSARYYPISRGVIKSFDGYVEGYEYVAVDGVNKCREVLEHIDSLSNMFLELNACDYACVNGPCSLIEKGSAVKANAKIRGYVSRGENINSGVPIPQETLDFSHKYEKLHPAGIKPTEKEILSILAKTGKTSPELELNCGACGYDTCREKACAVANGFADIEMCVPYMRDRAESMNYQVIQNSPNGILIVNSEFNIVEINNKAIGMLGIKEAFVKGKSVLDYFDASDIILAFTDERNVFRKKLYITASSAYIELNVRYLKKENLVLAVMKDITENVNFDEKLNAVKIETLTTTDEVIKKQMRVAQEIASLLGETTAETKVALLKLKQTLLEEQKRED